MSEEGDYQGYCSIEVALEKHIQQLGTSACGVTALVNVLLLLDIVQKHQLDRIQYDQCILRTRANNAPLPQYLYSRHHAGCTGEELVESIPLLLKQNQLSTDLLETEFLPYSQILEKYVSILECLIDKFAQGYIGIATMNLQVLGNDAWHHQVVFGVDTAQASVYAMNPLESIPMTYFTTFLNTDSILLVRREDVLQRLHRVGGDESVYEQEGWRDFHIAEQIRVLQDDDKVDFLIIPAAYKGGISFYRKKQSI